jgi:hypothetical protein
VAKALRSILDSCQNSHGEVAGALTTWGNGDLVVRARYVWSGYPPRLFRLLNSCFLVKSVGMKIELNVACLV